ncbi:hypothetical protein FGO68_gene12641 [Halteria grandinella]|uniref:TLDc domain-containing protein n=1 Tax=Halteria grandinella TaxID=5974 RepID=A0A8J8SZE9_HALGN|nr:hypothetical protein FGO68_gene12641 [Halteria grandinella]
MQQNQYKMEQEFNQSSEEEKSKYRLGRINNKYLIIQIMCWSDSLDVCVPIFTKSCKIYKSLYYENGMSFMLYGYCRELLLILREPESLIKTFKDINLIRKGLKGKLFILKKLYDSRKDGDQPKDFHEKCDEFSHTICVLRTNYNQLIGGYTSQTWKNALGQKYKTDFAAFLFSLTKKSLHPIKPGQEDKAICNTHKLSQICLFGEGDLFVLGRLQYSSLGKSYLLPNGIKQDSKQAESYLGGSNLFDFTALQTYQVIFL